MYRKDLLKKAAPGTLWIYNEGEKDVETAEKLGFLATTAGSASDWRPEFADDLAGFDLIIIPDNDIAGAISVPRMLRVIVWEKWRAFACWSFPD